MHEHVYHIISSVVPAVLLLWLFRDKINILHTRHAVLSCILLVFVAFHHVPVMMLLMAHDETVSHVQVHACCLPQFAVLTNILDFSQIDFLNEHELTYQLQRYIPFVILHHSPRSPPEIV